MVFRYKPLGRMISLIGKFVLFVVPFVTETFIYMQYSMKLLCKCMICLYLCTAKKCSSFASVLRELISWSSQRLERLIIVQREDEASAEGNGRMLKLPVAFSSSVETSVNFLSEAITPFNYR